MIQLHRGVNEYRAQLHQGKRSCKHTYWGYKAHRCARNSCAVSPWNLIGLLSLLPSSHAATLDVLVLCANYIVTTIPDYYITLTLQLP
ncbi:hypothetical protein K503DRAFT_115269 [Rhizopogon vinicolor AM-OR11-026]|uniref:Uncharacterized protein n=1 Tax=Rhizopogon vinicolor AM-OR11-026 TaxID=1314800 RepID=A0A1B7N2I5_9AGAM|nr:hypothetical protein K503DRAFT_115269 [Rhizopogon vinicolor AM-OR11-026]